MAELQEAVFYDTEFTTWPGALESNWGEPWQHRELVQIGAVRFDLRAGRVTDEFSLLVRPRKNPELSPYFINLTGITQDEVDKQGKSFPDAYRLFCSFIGGAPTACYGSDAAVVRENLRMNAMSCSPEEFDSLDIAPWLFEHGADLGLKPGVNSGKLAATLGAPMEGIQEHNALHDARSIAAAYRFLKARGAKDFFNPA